jgi:hypothetical protein
MLVPVPVAGGAFNSLLDLGPGFKPAAFLGQGAENLLPGLNEVETIGIFKKFEAS